ncbi:WD40-repeat-containing domain protein [Jimgerdemannia flammicorona]|uniref:Glutamate-rich WD repeat-containing protein 1 n=1 Tax=Jimgerdemannia flammicorona TaxID=994334 RepID=A0A433AXI8_9FUNG|nr:WD40-repeat-containing domain protein [Jimgerdemannia flammicorona]
MSQLHRTQHDDGKPSYPISITPILHQDLTCPLSLLGNESDSDGEDDLDEDPILEHRSVRHNGGVNRVRVMPQQEDRRIAATWSDMGKVHVWDLAPLILSLDTPGAPAPRKEAQPLFTIESHGRNEGFAMDWSLRETGRLLTGDISKNIYLTTLTPHGATPDLVPFRGHGSSVEDLQWSPSERNVFASCSADQTVRIWDTRNKKKEALAIRAAETDVNVITWNRKVEYLMASGGDDGVFNIWDLRMFKKYSDKAAMPTPVATFKWHSAPITSIEWHPTDESVLAVSGADDQISIWDLSVEPDTEEEGNAATTGATQWPQQLLFVHQAADALSTAHSHHYTYVEVRTQEILHTAGASNRKFLLRNISLNDTTTAMGTTSNAVATINPRSYRIALGDLNPNNIGQLRKLNSVLFPVHYSDKFYKEVLEAGELAKLGACGAEVCMAVFGNPSYLYPCAQFYGTVYFNDICVGAVCCRKEPIESFPDRAKLYIMTLGVLAPYRKLGLGTSLLSHILSHAQVIANPIITEVYLHVQISNEEALRFYADNGFEISGTSTGYYKNIEPADAHVLVKQVHPELTGN